MLLVHRVQHLWMWSADLSSAGLCRTWSGSSARRAVASLSTLQSCPAPARDSYLLPHPRPPLLQTLDWNVWLMHANSDNTNSMTTSEMEIKNWKEQGTCLFCPNRPENELKRSYFCLPCPWMLFGKAVSKFCLVLWCCLQRSLWERMF